MKGNFLTSGRPIETICNTIESSGTLWISGVENFSNALKSASEKNLQQTPETDGKFLNNIHWQVKLIYSEKATMMKIFQ